MNNPNTNTDTNTPITVQIKRIGMISISIHPICSMPIIFSTNKIIASNIIDLKNIMV